ncbi:HAD family hydrolase [Candidatus Woesearchaeota archaeon]|nr:HAD family hydrolase [Candidatus Woesearchaeota archaeon]
MRTRHTIYADLDGTILDTKKRHYTVYSSILRKHGYKPLNISDYWRLKTAGRNNKEILGRSKAQRLTNRFTAEWLHNIEKKEYLALDLLQRSAKKSLTALLSFRLVLVTLRRKRRNLIWQLERLGIKEHFSAILSAPPSRQPHKQKASLIKKDSQNNHKGIFIMGDTEADIAAAKALKIPAIAVTSGIRNSKQLLKLKPEFTAQQLSDAVQIIKKQSARR